MADRWWVDDNADGDWNAANNWAAAEGGVGGAGVPTALDRALFSNTSSPNNCALSANADCLNLFDTVANTGGTDVYTGDFDAATFDIHIHGDMIWINNTGAMDLGSGTWTCDGHFEWELATWTAGTSTLVMTTDGKEVRPDSGHRVLYNVTLQGSIAWTYLCTVSGAFSVSNGKTSSGSQLTIQNGPWTLTGATIANALSIREVAVPLLPADGVLSGNVLVKAYAGDYPELVGRVFGGNLELQRDARDANGIRLGTALAQTFTIAGDLTFSYAVSGGPNAVTYDAATYDPDITVAGDVDVVMGGAVTCNLLTGDGTWTVSGDCDLREATVTPANSELVLDGAGKSFWGNAQTFYDMTIKESITFADAFVVSNLFKCIVAAKTLTFTSGVTYAFADIQLDGQAAGTKIVLAPSGVAVYNWNVTASPQVDVSFVDVSYCDASAGGWIIASNFTNTDGGNNVHWKFAIPTGGLWVNSADEALLVYRNNAKRVVESPLLHLEEGDVTRRVEVDDTSVSIGDPTGTDYTDIDATGIQTMAGDGRVTKWMWIPAQGIRAPGAKAATYTDVGIGGAWGFADGQEEIVVAALRLPPDLDRTEDIIINLGWSSPAQSLNCDWEVAYLLRQVGEDVSAAAQQTLQSFETSAATANGLVKSDFTIAAAQVAATDAFLVINVMRDGNDPLDTLGDVAHLNGMALTYTSDKLGVPL